MLLSLLNRFPREKASDPWMIVVGGGLLQVPVVEEARKLGLRTVVTDLSASCPCAELADYFAQIDVFDVNMHIQLVLALKHLQVNLAGVIVAGIDATITGSAAARAVGLPGVDPLSAYMCKHKPAMRAQLARAGIPGPRWAEVETEQDVQRAIRDIGFPCIVKNTDSSASRGTRRFFVRPSRPVEFFEAVEQAKAVSSSRTALIEELLSGPEQTVETIFDTGGRYWPCFITDRVFAGEGQFAIETGLMHPTTLDESTQRQLYDMVRLAAEALGIRIGAAKADTMLTDAGPRIIEMTTRLSGGFDCQYLVPAATGKNVIRAALLTALGRALDPNDLRDRKSRFAVTGSVWPSPGKIRSINGVEEVKRIPGVDHIFLRCEVGDVIRPYEDCAARVAFVIASGASREEGTRALNQALATIRIEVSD